MAEIDKILPNVSQDVKLPSASKIALEQQQQMAEQMKQPSDLQPNEDGSVDVNFGPENLQVGPDQGHFSNLADMLPDDVLDPLGNELYNNYTDYKTSRKDWERSYVSGLDLLGFNYDDRTEPFKGASGATHPVLAIISLQRIITITRSSTNTDSWNAYTAKRITVTTC